MRRLRKMINIFMANKLNGMNALKSVWLLAFCGLIGLFLLTVDTYSITVEPGNDVIKNEEVVLSKGIEQLPAVDLTFSNFIKNKDYVNIYIQKGNDGKYYLIFPAGADLQHVVITKKEPKDFSIDGENMLFLDQDDGTYLAENDYDFRNKNKILIETTENGNKVTYDVSILKGCVPAVFIDTESNSMRKILDDKSYKEKGKLLAISADGRYAYQGDLKSIKGRGNSSWLAPKKPFNIKFEDNIDLFGMGSAKNWCLLTNFSDDTKIRNLVALKLADLTGCEYTSQAQSVDLYLNGVYSGLYLLTEKVEVGKNRVDIVNLEKNTEKVNDKDLSKYPQAGTHYYEPGSKKWIEIPNNPEDITGGYLMELEMDVRYMDEVSGFVTSKGKAVNLKSPEYASKEQVEYIASFIQDLENAVYSNTGKNDKGKSYLDYIDVDSFALMAILQEVVQNQDAANTSFYMYKDSDITGDGKLHACAAWDFDLAIGNIRGEKYEHWTDATWALIQSDNFVTATMKEKEVKQRIVDLWVEKFVNPVNVLIDENGALNSSKLKSVYSYMDEIATSADLDRLIWEFGPTRDARKFLDDRKSFINRTMTTVCPFDLHRWHEKRMIDEAGQWNTVTECYDCKLMRNASGEVIDVPGSEPDSDYESIRNFVDRLYNLVLDRKPDESGLGDWTERLVSKKITGAEAAFGFFMSEEMTNRGLGNEEFVKICYQTMLGREADESGLKDWVGRLEEGSSRLSVLAGFTDSLEYTNICNQYGIERGGLLNSVSQKEEGIRKFVARCYTKALGREYEESGLSDWTNRIADGSWTAEKVASDGFFHSTEFANKNTTNSEYVRILYRTFLGREADIAGYNYWAGQLYYKTATRDDVLYGFSRSEEFKNIMSQYIK